MKARVHIVPAALQDLEELHAFLRARESQTRADQVLEALEQAILGLASQPRRGHQPPELAGMGLADVREIHHKPWRILYALEGKTVTVLVVADGRRDFRSLLTQRLLRPGTK